jgi:hypothetical protein
MNTPGKIGPILVVAVLGLASLALLTRAWGETSGAKLTEAAWAVSGGDAPKHGDRLDTGMQGPGGHGRMWRCNAPGGFGPGGMHHHMGWHNPDMIAKRLNAMETEIGIRANQLDAWRDFTDALQGMMQRPTPPWQTADGGKGNDGKPQPFALVEGFANNVIARSKSAEALLKSIDALKTKLTPEQLDKVAEMEARFRAHRPGPGSHFDGQSPDDHDPQPNDSPQHGPDQGDRL